MRAVAFLFLLGCTSTAAPPKDPYAGATCDASWMANGFDQCEAGCADSAQVLGATGAGCTGALATGESFTCVATFEFAGVTGCCASDKPHLLFAECP